MNDTPSADTPQSPPGANPALQSGGPLIRVLGQYVKDLSFENPRPLEAQSAQSAPNIELGIDVKADTIQGRDNTFEVSLRLAAEAKRNGDEVVFIAELLYAGLFEIKDASQTDIEPMLLIECPRLLFPFARRLIAEITREGGYPPLLIDPIDFVGLYRKQRESETGANPAGEAPTS